MTRKGLKICKGCRKSFEPQLTDDEIFDLWFTEEEIEADEEHFERAGHSHLDAPTQELCAKCSLDPDIFAVQNMFGGPPQYRRRSKMRKLKVTDDAPLRGMSADMIVHDELFPLPPPSVHYMVASDGTKMEIHGPRPPQDVIDAMAAAVKAGAQEGTVKPVKQARITITRKKKQSLWEKLFGKKKP